MFYHCSKIGKLTLARLLMAHDAMMWPSANKFSHSEVLELYNDLMKLDPTHVQYYKDHHSLVLLQQVIYLFCILLTEVGSPFQLSS